MCTSSFVLVLKYTTLRNVVDVPVDCPLFERNDSVEKVDAETSLSGREGDSELLARCKHQRRAHVTVL
jgi:hypothetical protein